MDKTIFSAAVALTLFALAQIFLHLRARQTLLREKLESLFEAMNSVSSACMDYTRAIQEKNEGEIVTASIKLDQSLYIPRSLLLLYFPYLVDLWESSIIRDSRKICQVLNNSDIDDGFDPMELVDILTGMTLTIRTLQNFLARNQHFTTQSFSFYWNLIVRRKLHFRLSKEAHQQIVEQGGAPNPLPAE